MRLQRNTWERGKERREREIIPRRKKERRKNRESGKGRNGVTGCGFVLFDFYGNQISEWRLDN